MNDDNKVVQQLTINALMEFVSFCEKYKLRYYFTGGALIGVFRHKGFIPWDDDIDIGMPRPDFDKFHKLVMEDMPSGFGICNRFTDAEWHFAMSQFVDMDSEIEIYLAEQPRTAHIWLDIFPIDGLPSNRILRWLRVKNILLHRYLVQIAHISTQVDSHRKRPWYERAILVFFKVIPMGKLLNTNRILDHLERILRRTSFYSSTYCGNMLGRYREKEVMKTEWFGNPVIGEFEGKCVNVPQFSDEILRKLYGDYMQLPPEKERMAHNVKIVKCRKL